MATAWTLISATTVSGNPLAVTLSSIPQSYKDLYLIISGKNAETSFDNSWLSLNFNSDTGNNYSEKMIYMVNATPASASTTGTLINWNAKTTGGSSNVTNAWGISHIFIPNYAGGYRKTVLTQGGMAGSLASSTFLNGTAASWNSGSAITSLTLTREAAGVNHIVTGTTIYLYGIG